MKRKNGKQKGRQKGGEGGSGEEREREKGGGERERREALMHAQRPVNGECVFTVGEITTCGTLTILLWTPPDNCVFPVLQ